MQKFRMKNRMSSALLILLTALFVIADPGNAFADTFGCMSGEKGIFKTIACKVTTTLFDIRKIVYVLGGFGLVAFTFAAIFNKISFKHLANIALSLFLLSMMTPFIEYFVSSDGSYQLEYGSFLQPDFTEADYSMTFGECEGDDCPAPVTVAAGAPESGSGTGSGLAGGSGGAGGLGDGEGGLGIDRENLDMPPLEKPDLVIPGATTEMGKIDLKLPTSGTEVDTRTGWQKFKDTIKTIAEEGVKAYNTATTVVSAASTVYNTVDSTVKGFQGAGSISEVITAGVNAFNGYGNITGSITSAAGTIGTNYTDKEGEDSLGQKVGDFFKGSNDAANEGKGVTQDLGTINGTVNGATDFFGNIGNMF